LASEILRALPVSWDFSGAEEPARASLVLYKALCALSDARALQVLLAASDALRLKASTISELIHRNSYLNDVFEHRKILELSDSIA